MRTMAILGSAALCTLSAGCVTAPRPPDAPAATATSIVQRQVDAYNARDLDRFSALYSEDVRIFRAPAVEPAISGREALRDFYATERFNLPGLHADILQRVAAGNKVVDHERVFGTSDKPLDFLVVYEIAGERIRSVWIYPAR